jgi:DNA-binding IclR family transcriptional regulator
MNFAQRHGFLAKVGDRNPGLGGLAVPVFGATGIAGALTASGPQDRWSETTMHAVSSEMKLIALDLSVELGAPNDYLAEFGIKGRAGRWRSANRRSG